MSPHSVNTRHSRRGPRYSLWTLFVSITICAATLALVKLFGVALLDALLRIAIVGYAIIFLGAPFLVFTAVCLSNRLSFRHLPALSIFTAAALLTVPCFLVACDLFYVPHWGAFIRRIPFFLLVLFVIAIWWGTQAAFIAALYRHHQRHRQNPPLRQSTYPNEIDIPETQTRVPPPD
jgi:hypothetical protein